jgi:post-segregation antitoxin (ccd killing protein)
MIKYTKVKVLKITETQDKTLKKIKSYKVNVSQFIRDAIKEKIDREFSNLKPKAKIEYCPFGNNTIILTVN